MSVPRKVCLPMIECQPGRLHICSFFCFTLLLEGETLPKHQLLIVVEIFVSVFNMFFLGGNHLFPPSFSQFSSTSVSKLCNQLQTATNFPITTCSSVLTSPTSCNKNNLPKCVDVFKRATPPTNAWEPPINFTILWGSRSGC